MGQDEKLQRNILICLLLALGVLGAFWPVFSNNFINCDDQVYVTQNLMVQGGLTWRGLLWAFTTGHSANWHPLTWLSHMADVQFFGLDAGAHHGVSVALHLASTILLFLLWQRMTGSTWRSAIVAALFGWHPLRVESVAWAAERKDVLSTFFFMLSLWSYVAARCPASTAGVSSKPPRTSLLPAIIFFALGLMAKPMLVTLPFVLLLLDFWPLGRFGSAKGAIGFGSPETLPRLLWEKVPFFVLAAGSSVVTFLVQQKGGAVISIAAVAFGTRILNAAASYLLYLKNAVVPAGLAPFYPYSAPRAYLVGAISIPILLVATFLVWRFRASRPHLLTGWFWYLGTLVPVIGIVQVGNQAMADRYTYIPLIGIFIAGTWTIAEMASIWHVKPIAAGGAGALILLALNGLTYAQACRWRDSETLFRYTLAVTADNALAQQSLGGALALRGQISEAVGHFAEAVRIDPKYVTALGDLGLAQVSLGNIDAGIENYRKAIQLQPNYQVAHYNLGRALMLQGHSQAAADAFREAVRLRPDDVPARGYLAQMLADSGRMDEALQQFEQVLRSVPGDSSLQFQYASVLAAGGHTDKAILHFRKAISVDSANPEMHRRLGLLLARVGRVPEAIPEFREQARLRPDADAFYNLALGLVVAGEATEAVTAYRQALRLNPNLVSALNDLAWLLATHPDPSLRNGPEAVQLARKACELTSYESAQTLGTLDAACAEQGDFGNAIKYAEQSIAMARRANHPDLEQQAKSRLESYRSGKPWRQQTQFSSPAR